MPLWVLAERRLKATSSSSDAAAAASLAPGRKEAGSKPLKDSSLMPAAVATKATSRPSAISTGRWAGEARQSAIDASVSAVAKSSAP